MKVFLTIILAIVTSVELGSAAWGYSDPLDTPAMQTPAAQSSLLLDVVKAGKRLVVVGERGHILFSDDGGTSWQQAQVPAMAHLNAVCFANPANGWAVGEDAVILYTKDGGVSWRIQYDERQSDFPGPLLDVLFLNELEGFAIGAYGRFLHTVDGGSNWTDWRDHLDNPDEWHLNAITVSPSGTLYIAGEAGFVYRSSDGGSTWVNTEVPSDGSFFGIIVAAEAQRVVAFGVAGIVYVSLNHGQTWRRVDTGTQAGLTGATLLDDKSILIVGSNGIILQSNGLSNRFSLRRREDRLPMSSVITTSPGKQIAVGMGGIYHLTQENVGVSQQ